MSDFPTVPVIFISIHATGWLVSVFAYLRIHHADHPGIGIGFPELSRIFLLLVFWPLFLPYVLLLRLEHWLRVRHLLTVQRITAQMSFLEKYDGRKIAWISPPETSQIDGSTIVTICWGSYRPPERSWWREELYPGKWVEIGCDEAAKHMTIKPWL